MLQVLCNFIVFYNKENKEIIAQNTYNIQPPNVFMKNITKRKIYTTILILFLSGIPFFYPKLPDIVENLIISLISGLILLLLIMLEDIDLSKLRSLITKSTTH